MAKGKSGQDKTKSPGHIEISIDAKGNICLETIGTRGRQCDLLAGQLEASLGGASVRTNKETYEDG